MKEYILTIIYICIFCIILEIILPDNRLKKYILTMISLVIVVTIITPIVNAFKEENVIQTISTAIQSITIEKTEPVKYDFEKYKNRAVFSSVKQKLENEVYSALKAKFTGKYNITGVSIILDEGYNIDKVIIYADEIEEVNSAYEIIKFVEDKYNIKDFLIEVTRR